MTSDKQNIREYLLPYVPWFVTAAAKVAGVRRIALLGSLTTDKKDPKDIDFLVTVDDDVDLEPLARLGRKLQGRTGGIGSGADIFLANVRGEYIGRTCQWRECRPGIRADCDALNCGRRQYLHDDLNTISLSEETIPTALGLWPVVEARDPLPVDLAEVIKKLDE